MIVNKKPFVIGLLLSLGFAAVLCILFTPSFGEGRNAFAASDRLFNSIAKGSSHYANELRDKASQEGPMPIEVDIVLKDDDTALKAEAILRGAGASVVRSGCDLKVSGSLTAIAGDALVDSEAMFRNDGAAVRARHAMPEREAMFVWWTSLKEIQKALKFQGKGREVAFVEEVQLKGVEVGYNFYGIDARKASANVGILAFALLFYLLYTIWWGYAILNLFDGVGLQMKKTAKKEV